LKLSFPVLQQATEDWGAVRQSVAINFGGRGRSGEDYRVVGCCWEQALGLAGSGLGLVENASEEILEAAGKAKAYRMEMGPGSELWLARCCTASPRE
jgi:hypothetical protein